MRTHARFLIVAVISAALVCAAQLALAAGGEIELVPYVIRLKPPIAGIEGRLDELPVGSSDAAGWLLLGGQRPGRHELSLMHQGVACGRASVELDPDLNALPDFEIGCAIVDLDTNVAGAEVRSAGRLIATTETPSASARITIEAGGAAELEIYKEGFDTEILHLEAAPAGLLSRRVTLRPSAPRPSPRGYGWILGSVALLTAAALAVFVVRRREWSTPAAAESMAALHGADPDELQFPFSFDRYQVLALLARGGLAAVYRATDVASGETVALKILESAWLNDTEMVFKFLGEGEMLKRVRRHNPEAPVPKLFRSGREGGRIDGVPFLVMELVAGETLAARIARDGAALEENAIQVGLAVVEALASAHNVGIQHRDISPENILIRALEENDSEPAHESLAARIVLIDFGSARAGWDEEASLDLTISGKPRYMSPEQSAGQVVDGRSDLYSLGVVLYTMIRGRPPFEATAVESLQDQHANTSPDSLEPETGPAFARLVASLLSKSPDDRPSGADEVRASLLRIQGAVDWGVAAESEGGESSSETTWRM